MIDSFGSSDPKQMPSHLFRDAHALDYTSATRANIEEQNYTVCPRHWYIDAVFNCSDCQRDFLFSVSEQRFWYEERKFFIESLPVRCPECRKKERIRKKEAQLPLSERTHTE